MRTFQDEDGQGWEVVAGRESWGAIFAIFIPVEHAADVRQTPLRATGYEEANAELDALDDHGLTELLARSESKHME